MNTKSLVQLIYKPNYQQTRTKNNERICIRCHDEHSDVSNALQNVRRHLYEMNTRMSFHVLQWSIYSNSNSFLFISQSIV